MKDKTDIKNLKAEIAALKEQDRQKATLFNSVLMDFHTEEYRNTFREQWNQIETSTK